MLCINLISLIEKESVSDETKETQKSIQKRLHSTINAFFPRVLC